MSPRRLPARGFTPAEHDIARLVADGFTDEEIALQRGCKVPTVKSHVAHAAAKVPGRGTPRIRLTRHVYAQLVSQRSA